MRTSMFLIPIIFLILWGALAPLIYSDVQSAYNVLKDLIRESNKVYPELVNCKAVSVDDKEAFLSSTTWQYANISDYFNNQRIYLYMPERISGINYRVPGLPILSFVIDFVEYNISNFHVFSMSNRYEKNKYLTVEIEVSPDSGLVHLNWSIFKFDETKGIFKCVWYDHDFLGPASYIDYIDFYILPSFYSFETIETNETILIYGFEYRIVVHNASGSTIFDGRLAWDTITIARHGENITDYEFEKRVTKFYGWNVWIGVGAKYSFSIDDYAFDSVWRLDNTTGKTTILIKEPSVFSVYVDTNALWYKFVGLELLSYNVMHRYNTTYRLYYSGIETQLFGYMVALAIGLMAAFPVSRFTGFGASIIAIIVLMIVLAMMIWDLRIIIAGVIGLFVNTMIFLSTGSMGGDNEES